MGVVWKLLQWVVAIICAVVTAFIGVAGGEAAGLVFGALTGFLVGYYYVHFALKLRNRRAWEIVLLGTLYGGLAGLVAGGLVHVPSELASQNPNRSSSMLYLGALFGVIVGVPFGFILSCLIAFLPGKPEQAPPQGPAEPAGRSLPGEDLAPEELESALAVYPALKEHNLLDLHTSRFYRVKYGGEGGGPEQEKPYARALAWMQIRQPGFTQEQWEGGNAAAHRLARSLAARGEAGAAWLSGRRQGLDPEFLGWLEKAARLFK